MSKGSPRGVKYHLGHVAHEFLSLFIDFLLPRGDFSTFLDALRLFVRLKATLVGLGVMLSTTPSYTTSQFLFTYLDLSLLEVDPFLVSFWRVSLPILTMNSSMQIACVTMSSKVRRPWSWTLYPKLGRRLLAKMSSFSVSRILHEYLV